MRISFTRSIVVFALFFVAVPAVAITNAARGAILAEFAALAANEDPAFTRFSAVDGKKFFERRHVGGKPATPSCTTCHGASPLGTGMTRTGKTIAPMMVSKSPERFTDRKKLTKWFRRNCRSVLGRDCTATEKGNFISFMSQQ